MNFLKLASPLEETSYALGIELNWRIKNFMISPYVEYNATYNNIFRGVNYGLNAGYCIQFKERVR